MYVAEWRRGGGVVENDRVDEFTATGEFVLTVGGEVNETKVKEKAEGKPVTEEEENLCTAISNDECQEGKDSAAHGAFNFVSRQQGAAMSSLLVVLKTCCMSAMNTGFRSSRQTVNGSAKSRSHRSPQNRPGLCWRWQSMKPVMYTLPMVR